MISAGPGAIGVTGRHATHTIQVDGPVLLDEQTAMDITTVRWLLHMLAPRAAQSVATAVPDRS